MADIVVFAPAPVLTVTVEDHPQGPDLHLHAGGQGVWQARMMRAMGASVAMCASFAGEVGRVLAHLLRDEGFELHAVHRAGRGTAYLHDRRGGERIALVETPDQPLARHELDELYGLTLREGLAASCAVLSGPVGDAVVPADVYRRLAADLRTGGCRVVVDLAGERLAAALAGGVSLAKVSDEELLAEGRIASRDTASILPALRRLQREGADTVVVTRAEEPLLLLHEGVVCEVVPPRMEVVDHTGAGDSLTGALTASLAGGATVEEATMIGAAAGALNVTRHGLGTGDADAVLRLRRLVAIRRLEEPGSRDVSPDELAGRVDAS